MKDRQAIEKTALTFVGALLAVTGLYAIVLVAAFVLMVL